VARSRLALSLAVIISPSQSTAAYILTPLRPP
jgi:hypothetical protein